MVSLLGNASLLYKWKQAEKAQVQPHSILTAAGQMAKGKGAALESVELVPDYYVVPDNVLALANRAGSDDLKVLFIGNSITLHQINDYWWGEWGMAADSPEHDYVHRTVVALAQYVNVNYQVCNFGTWEVMAHDRGEVLSLLDSQLSEDEDLIVIQLGENVSDATTLASDYAELIRYCKGKAPRAKVLVIGNFWAKPEVEQAKAKGVADGEATLVGLDVIKDNQAAQSARGENIMDRHNQLHAVQHAGVAKHPGNAGMLAIATLLLKVSLN